MPPSERAKRRDGNFRNTGDHRRSAAPWTMLIGWRVINTSIGASGAVITSDDEDPMCRQTIVPRSEQTVGVQVAHGLVEVVAAGPYLLEGRRLDPVLLGRPPRHGVEPDVGGLLAVVDPRVGPVVFAHDPWSELGQPRR